MATVTFNGEPLNTIGKLPQPGERAPEMSLVKTDLTEVSLEDYKGQKKILNIFVSLDTSTCAKTVRTFNENAAELKNTVVLNISADLPFAQARFCEIQGINNVETLSTFRSNFPKDWGVEIVDGSLAGLCSRAIIVMDEDDNILHSEQVSKIEEEPDYQAALNALK